ncbi:transposase [Georgenia sp. 311]|uniref:transposase n=1 Tax=Georgenia sp. 311 TaxID=2585134 RepID=UPI00350E411F
MRAAYRCADLAAGRAMAERIVNVFHTCPIPEIARLGRTSRRWKQAFLAYFTTDRSNNGGTEATTASSSSTAASPAATATSPTTASACSSSPEDSRPDPHRKSEEPPNFPARHPRRTIDRPRRDRQQRSHALSE